MKKGSLKSNWASGSASAILFSVWLKQEENVLISTCYSELPQRWKYDRAPSLLRWKKKFQSKKKRQKAPFPGLSFFCELLPAKCKKSDSRAISGLKIAMLRKAPLRCSLGQSAFWGRVGYVDEDFLSECFCFLGRAEGVEFWEFGDWVEGSEYSEPEPNRWRLDARRPIGRIRRAPICAVGAAFLRRAR